MHHGQVNNNVSAFSATARSGAGQGSSMSDGMYDFYAAEMNNEPIYGASTQVKIRNGEIIVKQRKNRRERRGL